MDSDNDNNSDFSDTSEESELKRMFTACANYVQKVSTSSTSTVKLDNNNLLQIYGLYKVATVGKNTDPKPGFFDPRGRSKWTAWSNMSNLTTEQAMEEYVNLVKKLYNWDPNNGDDEIKNSSGFGGNAVSTFAKTDDLESDESKDTIFSWIKDNDLEKITSYIDEHGDLNIQDQDGLTPLHWAVDRGKIEIVQLLLKSGGNPEVEDTDGQTPLDYAITCEYEDIVKILQSKSK